MNDIETLRGMVESMESQLRALYEDRHNQVDAATLQSSLAHLESQLVALYSEKQDLPGNLDAIQDTLQNLEEQVISLTDEKMEIEKELESLALDIHRMRAKGKALGAAVFEAALLGDNHSKVA